MKKIIIEQNEPQQNAEINKINKFCNTLNQLLLQFKTDTGYSLTMDEVKKIMFGNNTTELKENLNSFLEAQLDTMQVHGTLMRENAKAGANNFVNTLQTQMKQSSLDGGYLHYLSMKNNTLIFEKSEEEKIRESFRLCIKTELAKEFYDKHIEAQKALNELSIFVKEKTSLFYPFIGELAKNFFYSNTNTGEVGIESIDYEICIQRRKMQNQKEPL